MVGLVVFMEKSIRVSAHRGNSACSALRSSPFNCRASSRKFGVVGINWLAPSPRPSGGWGMTNLCAALASLDWRAWLRSVGAEYAAIPRQGFKPFAAALAVIEKLAGVSGHQLAGLMATLGTGDRGLRNHAS